MNILIISKVTYPVQSPRAFRTAELSECLALMGHNVTVCVDNNNYNYDDYTERTGVKIKKMHNHLSIQQNQKIRNFVRRFLIKFFGRKLEIPHIEFLLTVPKAISDEKDVDLLITIAYPHQIHWGASRAKSKNIHTFPKHWIADCGDPYMFNPYGNHPSYFAHFEKKWCKLVDYITVPTNDSIRGYYPEYRDKIKVIPQGFDFSKTPTAQYSKNRIPTFIFTGTIYKDKRDPYKFMEYLASLDFDFKFIIYTQSIIPNRYINLLKDKLVVVYGANRKDIIWELGKADFLINITNPETVQTPSKLIDYALSGRPILNINSDFKEIDEFQQFVKGDYSSQKINVNIGDYDIFKVTNEFLNLAVDK